MLQIAGTTGQRFGATGPNKAGLLLRAETGPEWFCSESSAGPAESFRQHGEGFHLVISFRHHPGEKGLVPDSDAAPPQAFRDHPFAYFSSVGTHNTPFPYKSDFTHA